MLYCYYFYLSMLVFWIVPSFGPVGRYVSEEHIVSIFSTISVCKHLLLSWNDTNGIYIMTLKYWVVIDRQKN
jgi:hypothetical protein